MGIATKDAVIARAIANEIGGARMEKDALERSCAALIAKRDSLQTDIDALNAEIERMQTGIKESEGLIDELQIEVATVRDRVRTKEG